MFLSAMGTPRSCATLPDVPHVFLQVQILKLPVTLVLNRKFPAAPSQLPGMAPSLCGLPVWCRALGAVGSGTVGAWFLLCPRDTKLWGEVCTGEAKNLSDDPLISCCFHCSARQVPPLPHRAVVHLCSLSVPKTLTLSWASHPAAHPARDTALPGTEGIGTLLPARAASSTVTFQVHPEFPKLWHILQPEDMLYKMLVEALHKGLPWHTQLLPAQGPLQGGLPLG